MTYYLMSNNYEGDSISSLKGLEAVRHIPGMYIGDTQDGSGLHHMFNEILDNAVDEFLEGHCDAIWVTLVSPNCISVRDNGRGIPVSMNTTERKTGIEMVFEDLHAGGKFNKDSYKKSGGLHGVGASVVNALSIQLEATVWKGNDEYHIVYGRGKQEFPLNKDTNVTGIKRGTQVLFKPDPEIFSNIITFNSQTIINRIKQTAFLNSKLTIYYKEGVNGNEQKFYYENGLTSFLGELDKNNPICKDIYFQDAENNVEIKVALKWNTTSNEQWQCFTNNTYQKDGGTHLTSFRASLTKILLPLCKDDKIEVISDDLREGLTYIVSIYIANPRFSSQDKAKLVSSDVSGDLNSLIQKNLKNFFENNRFETQKIIDKARLNARAREASRKSKETILKAGSTVATGKLKECRETNPALIELFLVEGDSAGGTAKMARNSKYQAILPLRGKILNIEKASSEKVSASKEINILKSVIGQFPNYNYHKVIILTDADSDGQHIATLLLTLFYRHMPDLLEQGFVYMGRPPLYRVKAKNKTQYLRNDYELEQLKKKQKITAVQRFKGLGEMQPDELWETAMNPLTRTLNRIVITDVLAAEETFNLLMGSDVPPRKDFIVNSDKWKDIKLEY